jgi:putative protein-disulfide isomerase
MNLVYIGDPMCSWCWGFAPVLDAVREQYAGKFDFRTIVGGLRPGAAAEPMNAELCAFLREEWSKIRKVTGQPFDLAFLDRTDFLYDTEPAARAVVAMRHLKPDAEFDYFKRLQRAFYAENTDISDPARCRDLAEAFGVDGATFAARMGSDETIQATHRDFEEAQEIGIRGFPSLVVEAAGVYGLVTYGYRTIEPVRAALDHVLSRGPAAFT